MKFLIPILLLSLQLAAQTTDDKTFAVKKATVQRQPDSAIVQNYDRSKVFTFVEQQPFFPGGDYPLIKFIQKNLQYPKAERDSGIAGEVIVKFVVMEDGSVNDVQIARGINAALDNEAVRVVRLLPKFTPGKSQGKPVKVYFNLPVLFKKS